MPVPCIFRCGPVASGTVNH